MAWRVETTAEFDAWAASLEVQDEDALRRGMRLLATVGPTLGRPRVDRVYGSKYVNMKELRAGKMRALFIFDPKRSAVVLIGGLKIDQQWFYPRLITSADALYTRHLRRLHEEDRKNR